MADKKSKLQQKLDDYGLTQGDLQRMIFERTGFKIGRDRISRYVKSGMRNVNLETATMFAEALNVSVDDLNEWSDIKKENKV
jgi:hypothetical protein